MATVLDFPAPGTRAASAARRGGAGSAEIVIFPGIRYEYHDTSEPAETPAKPKTKRSERKRDRLEIAD